uniref:Secreted protein n=1 Tax=Trichobilharzia regenti TaxID=157069 RepID=A0AA85JSL8_TRIRE|nr:unnamed protein product [Trichobilharzia regenti]
MKLHIPFIFMLLSYCVFGQNQFPANFPISGQYPFWPTWYYPPQCVGDFYGRIWCLWNPYWQSYSGYPPYPPVLGANPRNRSNFNVK